METDQIMLRNVTYNYLEPKELRQTRIPAELISAAQIDITSKHCGCDYGLFYINYQNKFKLTIADTNSVLFFSRPFVHKRIENILNTTIEKGTNIINLEKAMSSENIAEFTERCRRYFRKADIVKTHIWEIKKDKLPKEKRPNIYDPRWFAKKYTPTRTNFL
ncbi:hypothetical protein KAJ38_02890 [Candidatus Pacearchaeota archaeon]|nr:hypothetical protein [Candidatus Pacearchaeota archaeon]